MSYTLKINKVSDAEGFSGHYFNFSSLQQVEDKVKQLPSNLKVSGCFKFENGHLVSVKLGE